MEITEIKVTPVTGGKLKAFVNITFDGCLAVRGIKIIRGSKGYFLSMPQRRRPEDGCFYDQVFPTNREFRAVLEEAVMAEYDEMIDQETRRLEVGHGK